MNLPSLFTALLAATAFSPPTVQFRITKPESTTSTYCVPTILPRMQRPRPDDLSLSPPALVAPSSSTTNNVTKDNNSTSSVLHLVPPPLLTFEDIFTAIFRIIITILTLFNVNITWRIRGEYHRNPAPNVCASTANVSGSQPRSSTSWVEACIARCEVGGWLSKTLLQMRMPVDGLGWIWRKTNGKRMRGS